MEQVEVEYILLVRSVVIFLMQHIPLLEQKIIC